MSLQQEGGGVQAGGGRQPKLAGEPGCGGATHAQNGQPPGADSAEIGVVFDEHQKTVTTCERLKQERNGQRAVKKPEVGWLVTPGRQQEQRADAQAAK